MQCFACKYCAQPQTVLLQLLEILRCCLSQHDAHPSSSGTLTAAPALLSHPASNCSYVKSPALTSNPTVRNQPTARSCPHTQQATAECCVRAPASVKYVRHAIANMRMLPGISPNSMKALGIAIMPAPCTAQRSTHSCSVQNHPLEQSPTAVNGTGSRHPQQQPGLATVLLRTADTLEGKAACARGGIESAQCSASSRHVTPCCSVRKSC
jgi:hypothetical protein